MDSHNGGSCDRVQTLLLVLVALFVTGCSPPERELATPELPDRKELPLVNPPSLFEPPPTDPGEVAWDDTLYRTLNGNPGSLNPLFLGSGQEGQLAGVLFDWLFTADAELEWMPVDHVVDHWEESADHLSWTIRMRPGLAWHDGHARTAEDVCFSWREILDERVPCPGLRTGTDQIVACELLDELTLRLRFREALPTNRWNALFPVIPRHLHEQDKAAHPDLRSGPYYEKLNRAPVGSGPYRFVRWLENDRIELERWEDWPGPRPCFKRRVYRIIPDQNMRLLSFVKGEVDEFQLTPAQFATQTGPGSHFARLGRKLHRPQWSYSYICWNQDGSNPFFGDVRVRRAMTHACNIPRMIRDLAHDLYQQSRGIFHPDAPWFNPEVELLEYDLERAASLLDEAGWLPDPEQEGWRAKIIDGRPVRLEFTLFVPQASAMSRAAVAIFQEDLESIGVRLSMRLMEWATFQERIRRHEFQAALAAWGTGLDPDSLWSVWHSGRNAGGYSNPRVDELFELARREFDLEKRRSTYREIHKLIYDEQPYTFLWNRASFWAVNKRLRGLTTSPRGLFGFWPSELGWWVRPGEQ